MAKEWYLLSSSTKPNSIGGYENEGFQDYKDDAFSEALETDIATTVILYNHDLSESQEIRCIIQGNTSDTQLKSIERSGLFVPHTVKAGMYVLFENRYWLIDGYPGTQGTYEKATMCLCQYNLRWQNADGKIIERWCNLISASKYDVGEGGNNTIFLTSNNFTMKMTCDDETMELERKRVFIDKRQKNPTKVFKITRNDDVLYDYGDKYHGSILSFIVDKDELNKKTDNQELRICDYFNVSFNQIIQSENPQEMTISIVGSDTLRIGKTKSWTAEFKDKDGNDIECSDWEWNIKADFNTSELYTQESELDIKITAQDDDSLVDESFLLQILSSDGTIWVEKQIDIIEGF